MGDSPHPSAPEFALSLLEEPACPLCQSERRLRDLRLGPAWVMRCQDCGLRYAWPRLGPQARERLYRENPSPLPESRHQMLQSLMSSRAQTVFDEAWPLFPGNAAGSTRSPASNGSHSPRLLEIGCGFGHFLAAMRDRGLAVEGCELSEHQARFAREHFQLAIHEDNALTRPWPKRFEVIAAFELIEHVPDPQVWLEWAFRLLSPGGQLILSTPNDDSLFRRLLGRHWFYHIPSEHLSYFSAKSLIRALGDIGFAQVRTCTSGRSLWRERRNDHNDWHPELGLAEQWRLNLQVRERIERERESTLLPPAQGFLAKWRDSLWWRLLQIPCRHGYGDQLRVYARKAD